MWLHPATQANLAILRDRGHVVLEPERLLLARLAWAGSEPVRSR
jgi:phosphopantothenoylcysteine synthetase/decarboxylase